MTTGGSRFFLITSASRSMACAAAERPQAGLFSAAFYIVLEKFGLLDYETLAWDDYRREPPSHSHVVLLTAPATCRLTADDLAWLESRPHPALVEGCWPAELDETLGVSINRQARPRSGVRMLVEAPELQARLETFLGGIKTPSNSGAYTDPDSLYIRDRVRRERQQSDFVSAHAGANPRATEPSWEIRPTKLTRNAGPIQARPAALLRWTDGSEPCGELLVRKGHLLLAPWELLSYLGQDYTIGYEANSYAFSDDRYTLELLLVTQLLSMLDEALQSLTGAGTPGLAGVRLAPWPAGKQYALTVRFDVDRPPTHAQLEQLKALREQTGVGYSCYFLERTATAELVRQFEQAGAEIAYHSAYFEANADAEIDAVARHARGPIRGSTVHGNAGFYGWRGVANWRLAAERRFRYAEHLSAMRYFPSRVFELDDAGSLRTFPFVALPHHVSLDRGMRESHLADLAKSIPVMARNQMHVTILNHPDLNTNDLVTLVERYCPAKFAGMTADEVASWWQATHQRENFSYTLRVTTPDSIEIAVRSSSDVTGATFELPTEMPPVEVTINGIPLSAAAIEPTGQTALATCGYRVTCDVPRGESRIACRWSGRDRAMGLLCQRIIDWFTEQNGKPTKTAETTARFNSTQVEGRLLKLIEPLAEILTTERELRLLDVGCGFGGLATYLAASNPRLQVHATDVSPRFYRVAERAAGELSLPNLTFATADLTTLDQPGAYDIVLLSNMLCFLNSADALRQGCANAWSAVRPGGWIAAYTPHFFSLREPFTRLPGLQLLPREWQSKIALKTGKRSTMNDIRLPSLGELKRIFGKLGATELSARPAAGKRTYNSTHIYLWIRKPAAAPTSYVPAPASAGRAVLSRIDSRLQELSKTPKSKTRNRV